MFVSQNYRGRESFKKVVDINPDTILLIAGKPWENNFAFYQQIIDKNNLSANIISHIKFIPHEHVEHYYCASDLVVLPYKKIYQSDHKKIYQKIMKPFFQKNNY